METVKLAEEFMLSSDGLVVGIDLSGDPTVSHTMLFHIGTRCGMTFTHVAPVDEGRTWQRPASCSAECQELWTEAVAAPLRGRTTTLFSIELYCSHEPIRLFTQQKSPQVLSQLEETDLLLDLPPDRIGHGTFLHPEVGGSEDLVQKVLKNNIPLGKTEVLQWSRAAAGF